MEREQIFMMDEDNGSLEKDVLFTVEKILVEVENIYARSDYKVIQCRRNLSTADGGHDLGPSVGKTIEKGRSFKPIEKGRVFPLIPASLRLQPILPRTTAQPKKTNEQKSSVASYLPILSKKFNKKASDYRAPNGEDPKLSRNESEQSKQSSDSSIMSSVESVVSRMRASSPNSHISTEQICSIKPKRKRSTGSREQTLMHTESIAKKANSIIVPSTTKNMILSNNHLAMIQDTSGSVFSVAGTNHMPHYYIKKAPIPSTTTSPIFSMMQQTYIQLTPSSAQQVANEKAEIKPIEGISNQRVAQEKGPAAVANLAPSTGKSRIPRKPNDFKKVSLSSKPIHIQPKSKATPITNNELPNSPTISRIVLKMNGTEQTQPNNIQSQLPNNSFDSFNSYQAKSTPNQQQAKSIFDDECHKIRRKRKIGTNSDSKETTLEVVQDGRIQLDEEENEPPPILDPGEQSVHKSQFLRQATLARERTFVVENMSDPIRHVIDGGLVIEEGSEPFPCEHRRLIKKLGYKNLNNGTRDSKNNSPNNVPRKDEHFFDEKNINDEEGLSSSSEIVKRLSKSSGKKKKRVRKGKGKHREVEGLLAMDFGPGKNPFPTKNIHKYTEEVIAEAQQQQRSRLAYNAVHDRWKRQSSESSQSMITEPKKSTREKLMRKRYSPPDSFHTRPTGKYETRNSTFAQQSKNPQKCSNKSNNDHSLYQDESLFTSEIELCLGCNKPFKETGSRDSGNPQYCSKECRQIYKQQAKRSSDEKCAATNYSFTDNKRPSSSSLEQSDIEKSKPISGSQKRKPVVTLRAEQGVGSPLVKSPQNTLNEFRSPQQNTSNNSHQSPPTRMSTEQSPPMIAAPIPSLPAHQSHQIFHQYLPYQNSHQFASHSTLFPQEPVQRQMGTSWPYLQGSQCPPSIFSPESAFVQHSQSPTLMPKMTGTSSPPISFNYGERGPELEILLAKGIYNWTFEDVCKWANIVTNSGTNCGWFVQEEIDGAALLRLSDEHIIKEFKLGPAIKLTNALKELKNSLIS